MQKGISIHIGLNEIDPSHYGDSFHLRNAENDAKCMKEIADSSGYDSTIILSRDATSAKVFEEISKASSKLGPGDILFLTYAGHGSQVPDLNGEEGDNYDETWVLYDRMVADDEINQQLSRFHAGVRIIVLSDSCHSGSVIRSLGILNPKNKPLFRLLDPVVSDKCYRDNKTLYDSIQYSISRDVESKIGASVILISGCKDNQWASDGVNNGLFTAKLLDVYYTGNFNGNYVSLHDQIKNLMSNQQTPEYFFIGTPNQNFVNEKPFYISNDKVINRGSNGIGQNRFRFEIEIPDGDFRSMNEHEFEKRVKQFVPDLMTEAFAKLKNAHSIMPQLRNGSKKGIAWGADCSVDKGGWSFSGGIKDSF